MQVGQEVVTGAEKIELDKGNTEEGSLDSKIGKTCQDLNGFREASN